MRRRIPGPPDPELVAALPASEILVGLDAAALAALDARLSWWMLPAGEELFRQGEPGDALWRLISGRLEVLKDEGLGPHVIADIGPGEWLGTLALLTGDPRRATVRARRDTVLARLDANDFRDLSRDQPGFVQGVSRHAVRQALDPKRDVERDRVIVLVPASKGVGLRALAESLGRALSRHGTTRVVHSAVHAGLSDTGPDAFGTWLDREETRCRFLLLAAQDPEDAWARAALRNADRVVLVATAGGAPQPVPATRLGTRRELVLVHDTHARLPRGASTWLDRLDVQAHHHVRHAREGDVDRLARFLAGRAVGLVLAGGAGRGLSHLGVIRALEEAGIPIDVITGTSMGAIIGAQLAAGWTLDEVTDTMRGVWTDPGVLDYTLPAVSITRGAVVRRELRRLFGGTRIEDLWCRFACVSTSLPRATRVEHTRGGVVTAVRASSALPGLLPPVRLGNDLLVDGAFVDNLPADLARSLGAGFLIAVNVNPAVDPVFETVDRKRGVRSWLRRFNPMSPDREPMIHDVVMRAYFVPTVLMTDAVRGSADLFIEPPLGSFGFLDRRLATFEQIRAVGYHEALRVLREARARGVDLPTR